MFGEYKNKQKKRAQCTAGHRDLHFQKSQSMRGGYYL